MKKFYILLLLAATMMVGCYNPPSESKLRFGVDNKTPKEIGMVSKAFPYEIFTHKVGPFVSDTAQLVFMAQLVGVGSFEICNLNDTLSFVVSDEEMKQIYGWGEIKTERDRVIYKHLKRVDAGGEYWIITDELLSWMEYDETLPTRYPEFYQ